MPNLLQKASIVLTPTAYDNGKVLCAKPVDGSGDFDFSRNSSATRVNAQGLVEDVQILSSNLVQNGSFSQLGSEEITNGNFSQQGSQLITNGDFATDSDWIKGTGWSISGGTANCDGSQTGNSDLIQTLSTIAGRQYEITYTVSNYLAGNIKARLSSGNTTSIESSNGTFTEIITAVVNGGFRLRVNDTFTGSIDNVSVVEVGQDWTFGTGWSVGDSAASCDGTQTGGTSLYQSALQQNKSYKITFSITSITAGGVGVVNSPKYTTTGTFTYYYKVTGTDSNLYVNANTDFIGSVTNISVKEVGQNWSLNNWSIGDNFASSGNTSFIQQSNVYTSATKIYKTTFKARSVNGTSVTLRLYDGNNSFETFTITSTTFEDFALTRQRGGGNTILYFYNNSNAEIEITNISVIEITDDTNLPRINYEGFSYQDALGSEKIVNGDFENGSANWSLTRGNVINNELVFNTTGAPSGSRSVFAIQNSVADLTKVYKVQFTISNYVSGQFRLRKPFITTDTFGNGTYTYYGTASEINFELQGRLDIVHNFSIDNVSVKEVTGQEVVPDSGCGSWLWEPQSTNLVTNSSKGEYGNSPASEILATAPDGSNDAIRPVPDGNSDRYQYTIGGGSYATDSKLTYSWYRRRISTPVNDTYVGDLRPNVLVNCTQVGSTTQVQSGINNFDRFEAIFNITDGSLSTIVRMYFGPVIGIGNSSVAYWGHQLEAQTYSTSLIPTDGTSVTRNQDVCTNGGSAASINSTEGVLYAQIAALADDGTTRSVSISNGNTSNRIVIRYRPASGQIQVVVISGSVTQALITKTGLTTTNFAKVALKYSQNDIALWINGIEVGTDTSGLSPIGLNNLSFDRADGSNKFFGKTKALAVWKEALTDTELQELTTI